MVIIDMNMPKCCGGCKFYREVKTNDGLKDSYCCITYKSINDNKIRDISCPLSETSQKEFKVYLETCEDNVMKRTDLRTYDNINDAKKLVENYIEHNFISPGMLHEHYNDNCSIDCWTACDYGSSASIFIKIS